MTRIPVLILLALLAGCVSRPPAPSSGSAAPQPAQTDTDGAPRQPPDVSQVPDAVPRHEPKSRYGNPPHYEVFGERYYVLDSADNFTERGIASWYGTKFHGRRTSSGEPYDMYAMTAAHKQLPLPSYVEVTNLANGRKVIVRVNDRGPFKKSRVIDLSYAAAARLDMLGHGTAPVELRVVTPATPVRAVTTTTDPAAKIAYYIQTGAFADRMNAERLRGRLDGANLGVSSQLNTVDVGGRRLHRVRLGPLQAVDQVDRLSDALARLGVQDTQVVVQD
jgi:rare lipoprotein A